MCLIDNLFKCVNSHFLALFDEAWLHSYDEVEEICNTFNRKFEKLDKLHQDAFTNLWGDVQNKTITSYLTSMMRRKVAATSDEERHQIAEKIRREAEIFTEFFSAIAKEDMDKPFCSVLTSIANIIATDEEMLTFELMTFLSKYSNITEEHVISILFLRGMSRSDSKQIASDILNSDEDSENIETKNGMFSDVKVHTGLINVKNILLDKF